MHGESCAWQVHLLGDGRRKPVIRGVAPFTQQVNVPSAENVHILSVLSITISDQLGILGLCLPGAGQRPFARVEPRSHDHGGPVACRGDRDIDLARARRFTA